MYMYMYMHMCLYICSLLGRTGREPSPLPTPITHDHMYMYMCKGHMYIIHARAPLLTYLLAYLLTYLLTPGCSTWRAHSALGMRTSPSSTSSI